MKFEPTTGGLELLKWLGLVLMVGDHINAGFFHRELPVLTEWGRLVFPIFAAVLGYNLARPGVELVRISKRLALWACVAIVPHVLLFGHLVPANVLFTFLVATVTLQLWDKRNVAAAATVFLLGGAVVEYNWPGVGLVLATVHLVRHRTWPSSGWLVVALGSLHLVNGTWYHLWAVAVVALVLLGRSWSIERQPRLFYFAYPAHLAVMAVVAVLN